ncbi:ribosomal protein L7/L12 [Kitasatospora sp. NPDC059571]|uniref:ribosomal protein L7/L12 n=1 Tax=Kitasatospora sp. NPDC059571 TaxID=3346871 RepID=UPI00368E4F0D
MEDPDFSVRLTGRGDGGIRLVRAVRQVTGLSLWQSKLLAESAPATVAERLPFPDAARAAAELREAGAAAEAVCTWCTRAAPADGSLLEPGPCDSPYWPTAHCAANSLTECDCGWMCGPALMRARRA